MMKNIRFYTIAVLFTHKASKLHPMFILRYRKSRDNLSRVTSRFLREWLIVVLSCRFIAHGFSVKLSNVVPGYSRWTGDSDRSRTIANAWFLWENAETGDIER